MVLHLSDSKLNFSELRDLPAPSSNNVEDKIGEFKAGYIPMKKKNHHQPRTEEEDGGGSDDKEDKDEHSRRKRLKRNISETEVTASNLHKDALHLPEVFTSSNGVSRRCRDIIINDGGKRSWTLDLRFDESSGTFYVTRGWRSLCEDNGKKAGGLFVFKLVASGETPLLSFCPVESRGEKACKKESRKNHLRYGNSTSLGENRYVTLTNTSFRRSRMRLPLRFTRENGMIKPRLITLLGKDGKKWWVNLVRDGRGKMSLGKGWVDFAKANGLKIGESLTWKDETPILSLLCTDSSTSTRQQGEYCSKAKEKVFASTEPTSGNKTERAKNKIKERRDSSSPGQNRFVTLTLTPDDVRDCKLILPSEFMRANGINKLGKITLLGKDGMKWFGYMLSKAGIVAVGCGWKGFCEANGVKTGESFTLECCCEQDTTHVFKFCSTSSM